jgi:hypothetical protein
MQYGPPATSAADEAEYYAQELRAQRLRAKQLFHCYLEQDEAPDDPDDDYSAFYEQSAR